MRNRIIIMLQLATLMLVIACAACGLGEALGVSDPSNRGLAGNVIVRDDYWGTTCGVNQISVTVSGGSYGATDVTKQVPFSELTGLNQGYWNVSDVPIGLTVTVRTQDNYGETNPAELTVTVAKTSINPAPAQVVGSILVTPTPGFYCICDNDYGSCHPSS